MSDHKYSEKLPSYITVASRKANDKKPHCGVPLGSLPILVGLQCLVTAQESSY